MIGDLILFLFWQHEGEAKNGFIGRVIRLLFDFNIISHGEVDTSDV